ncbi:MAG TPA: hypothetical protein VFN35_02900 [Ktedonobacteraceae bacterium]|nr:hypothetical protein [Ktedonobacteraceae bacterium]
MASNWNISVKKVLLIGSLAILCALSIFAGTMRSASAATISPHHKQTQTSQAVIPLAGGGHFDVSVTGAHVTGNLSFINSFSFVLTNVTLSDTACDASSAFFKANDNNNDGFTVHQNGNGCHGKSITYPSLTGSSSQPILNVFIDVWDNAFINFSQTFDNPFN